MDKHKLLNTLLSARNWAARIFTVFFIWWMGTFITVFIAALVYVTLYIEPVTQIGYYLATNPAFNGLAFNMRLAIFGAGLFIFLAAASAILMGLIRAARYYGPKPEWAEVQTMMAEIYTQNEEIRARLGDL